MTSLVDDSTRFAFITQNDQGGRIWVATLVSLSYAFVILGARAFIKRQRYSWDDTALIIGYLCALAHWSTVLSALKHGLGKPGSLLTDAQESQASALIYASRILLFFSLAFSKCSILLLIRLVFMERRGYVVFSLNIILGLVLAWGIGSALAVSIGCSPDDTIRGNGAASCADQALRWKIVTAFDVIIEVGIVLLCAYFVKPLQMRFKRKFMAVFAFSFRLPVAVLSIVSMSTYLDHIKHETNMSLTTTICWQEALLSYSLMSATIPLFKGFIQSFNTAGTAGAINPNSSRERQYSNSYPLNSISKPAHSLKLRPDDVGHSTEIYTGDLARQMPPHGHGTDHKLNEENGSTASKGSKEMIIKKTVEWGYKTNA